MKHFVKFKTNDAIYSISDLKDNPSFISVEENQNSNQQMSFPIYDPDAKCFYGSPRLLHNIIFGGTGSGKSALAIINQIHMQINQKSPFLAIGSPDIVNATYNRAKKRGYDNYVLDLENLSQSDCYSMLEKIYIDYQKGDPENKHKALNNLKNVFHMLLTSNGVTKDIYWEQSAMKSGEGGGALLLNLGTKEEFNLANIFKTIDQGMNDGSLKDAYKRYLSTIPELAQLSVLVNAPTNTAASIQSVFNERLSLFAQDELVRYIFSHNEFPNFEKVKDKKVGIYVILPFTSANNYLPMVKLLLLDVIQSLVNATTVLNDQKGKRFLIACDEFASYAFDEIATYISNSRKYNIQWSIALQSPSQLNKFGTDFKNIILDNCMVKVYLAMNNTAAMKEISDFSGTKTIYYENRKVTKNIISYEDLKGMPNRSAFIQYDNIVIFDYLTPYFEIPSYKDIIPYAPRRVLTNSQLQKFQRFKLDKFTKNTRRGGWYDDD